MSKSEIDTTQPQQTTINNFTLKNLELEITLESSNNIQIIRNIQ